MSRYQTCSVPLKSVPYTVYLISYIKHFFVIIIFAVFQIKLWFFYENDL